MAKFVAILLLTGEVFVHETLTGVSICGFSTNVRNANAIWIGQQKLDNEFKQEDQYMHPLSGSNPLYEDLSGQTVIGQQKNILNLASDCLKDHFGQDIKRLARNDYIFRKR